MLHDLYAFEHNKKLISGCNDIAAVQAKAGFGRIGIVQSITSGIPSSIASPKALDEEVTSHVQCLQPKECCIKRVNIIADDTMDLPAICTAVQAFELVSVEPLDERSLQMACTNLNIDIITFDISRQLPFALKLPLLKKAAARGLHIELQLDGVFAGGESLKNGMAHAQGLLSKGFSSRRLLLSSGRWTQQREAHPPQDIMMLATLLGLTSERACRALSSNASAAITHGVLRRNSDGITVV